MSKGEGGGDSHSAPQEPKEYLLDLVSAKLMPRSFKVYDRADSCGLALFSYHTELLRFVGVESRAHNFICPQSPLTCSSKTGRLNTTLYASY